MRQNENDPLPSIGSSSSTPTSSAPTPASAVTQGLPAATPAATSDASTSDASDVDGGAVVGEYGLAFPSNFVFSKGQREALNRNVQRRVGDASASE